MSWLYVPGLEGLSSASRSSMVNVPAPSVGWRGISLSPRVWRNECKRGTFNPLLSTLTSDPLTVACGLAEFLSSLPGPHANHSPPLLEVDPWQRTSSPTSPGSPASAGPQSSLPRTSGEADMGSQPSGSLSWNGATKFRRLSRLPVPLWVRLMTGRDFSYLPTPTAKANHFSPSMAKWPAYAALQRMFPGAKNPPPKFWEWMMGWPIGLTAVEPLAMESFPQWRLAHGLSSPKQS